jgi:2'-5' RNA ligase
MVFLGNVNPDAMSPLQERVKGVCSEFGPFRAAIEGMGTFPNRRRPRVIWLGLKGELDRLSLFRDALQQNLVPFGIKAEKRPFRPHLTLGRFRKGRGKGNDLEELLSRYEEVKSPSSMLKELVLFRSDLKPTGAVYTRLAAWPLSGAA